MVAVKIKHFKRLIDQKKFRKITLKAIFSRQTKEDEKVSFITCCCI